MKTVKVKVMHCADELIKKDTIFPPAWDAQLGAWRNEMDQSSQREGAFTELVLWDASLLSSNSCGVTALKGLCSQFAKMDEQIG